ncbi:MAG: hypothetical protein ACTHZ1_11840 [Sphingobacterium sp.]
MKQLTFLFIGLLMLAMASCGGEGNNNRGVDDPMEGTPGDQMMPMDDTMGVDSLDSLEGPLRP